MGLHLASCDKFFCNCALYWPNDLHYGHFIQIPLRQGALRSPLFLHLHGYRVYRLGDILHGGHAVPVQLRSAFLCLHILQSRCCCSYLYFRKCNQRAFFLFSLLPPSLKSFSSFLLAASSATCSPSSLTYLFSVALF